MRVLFITNIPSPYRVDFFNELGKYCDLTVLFERAFSKERDSNWKNYTFSTFRGIIMKGIKIDVDKSFCPEVIKYLKKERFDIIVIANTITPTGMLEIVCLKLLHMRYFLEADGAIIKRDNPIKKRIKTILMSDAYGYFSSAKSLDYYFCNYGADVKRIFRYPFSSIKQEKILYNKSSAGEKRNIKKKLGICEEKVVLYAGQFIYRKGIDVLLNAWAGVRHDDTGLYLIGGELSEDYKHIIQREKLSNINVINFLGNDELANYYRVADVFVLPTREDIWGLVINEALAYGLPVITTKQCVAGLEMIENGKNGFLVESEDSNSMAEMINCILDDDFMRNNMAEYALKTATKYTIENMVKIHMDIFEKELTSNNKKDHAYEQDSID